MLVRAFLGSRRRGCPGGGGAERGMGGDQVPAFFSPSPREAGAQEQTYGPGWCGWLEISAERGWYLKHAHGVS